jgi:hypothetical protein
MSTKRLAPEILKSIADAKSKGKSYEQWQREWSIGRDKWNAIPPSKVEALDGAR